MKRKGKKKSKLKIVVVILLIFLLIGFLGIEYGPRYGFYLIPPSEKQYVKIALDFMDNGIYANGEEWEKAKENALNEAKSAKNYEDTYDTLRKAAEVAGGKHSGVLTKEVFDKEVS